MTCTIIVGGQYGSEGKGKVTAQESRCLAAPFVVRCGGPNSGHGVVVNGRSIILRQVPAGVVNNNSMLLLGAACVIDFDVLCAEIEALSIPRERLIVDPRAILIEAKDRDTEREWSTAIGSTASGTGAALIRRMQRTQASRLAGSFAELHRIARVEVVADHLNNHLDAGGDVIVEGTQGFGLSLFHGLYPYVTSRDTTAAAFAAEVGVSPRVVDRVIMVMRTFPIRVGGNSGPLFEEMSWEAIRAIGGAPEVREEFTSVTRKLRRVGAFDWDLAQRASQINRPTDLALMGLDRLEFPNTGETDPLNLGPTAVAFIHRIEQTLNCRIRWGGTGFADEIVCLGGKQ